MGLYGRQVHDGCSVVVLSFLASSVLPLAVRARSDTHRTTTGCGVRGIDVWECVRRMASERLHTSRHEAEASATCGNVDVRMLRIAGRNGRQSGLGVAGGGIAFIGG